MLRRIIIITYFIYRCRTLKSKWNVDFSAASSRLLDAETFFHRPIEPYLCSAREAGS